MPPQRKDNLNVRIPSELHSRIYAICSELNMEVRDAVTEAMSWWVSKYTPIAQDHLNWSTKELQGTSASMQLQEWVQLDQEPPTELMTDADKVRKEQGSVTLDIGEQTDSPAPFGGV